MTSTDSGSDMIKDIKSPKKEEKTKKKKVITEEHKEKLRKNAEVARKAKKVPLPEISPIWPKSFWETSSESDEVIIPKKLPKTENNIDPNLVSKKQDNVDLFRKMKKIKKELREMKLENREINKKMMKMYNLKKNKQPQEKKDDKTKDLVDSTNKKISELGHVYDLMASKILSHK